MEAEEAATEVLENMEDYGKVKEEEYLDLEWEIQAAKNTKPLQTISTSNPTQLQYLHIKSKIYLHLKRMDKLKVRLLTVNNFCNSNGTKFNNDTSKKDFYITMKSVIVKQNENYVFCFMSVLNCINFMIRHIILGIYILLYKS